MSSGTGWRCGGLVQGTQGKVVPYVSPELRDGLELSLQVVVVAECAVRWAEEEGVCREC